MPGVPLVILNPASRSGATGRRWARVEARLRDRWGSFEVERTRGPRDAERIAREAVRAGVEMLVVAGGDGTTSEVVNGLLAAELGGYARLGFLPLGTGGDLMRCLGVPRDLDAAADLLRAGTTRTVDAGRIRYCDREGRSRTRFFVNVASFGISGLVDELVNTAPKRLGGSASFLIGTLRALLRYRPATVRIRLDGESVHDGPLSLAAAANGNAFGGGMRIAPRACPSDGALDLVIIGGGSRLRLLARLPSLYRGAHLGAAEVRSLRGRCIEAEAASGAVWLDVDGEPIGTLPARIEVLPGALSVVTGGAPAAAGDGEVRGRA